MNEPQQIPQLPLNDGRTIPQIGFGVYQVVPADVERVVLDALDVGYRHIDTAAVYLNEEGVGRAIACSGLAREDIFLTTKLWNADQGYDSTFRAFDASLERLQTDYVDLYLIHWPSPGRGRYLESWRALEEIASSGRARSIGVSNFLTPHLQEILGAGSRVPAVNQIELHPRFQQRKATAVNERSGIVTQAYSPLAQGAAHHIPEICEIAARYDRSPAQVVLRWHVQRKTVVIPKTLNRERMIENLGTLDFTLDDTAMRRITGSSRTRV